HPPPCFINMVMIASFPQSPTSTHFLPQHYTLGFSGIKRQDLKKRKNLVENSLTWSQVLAGRPIELLSAAMGREMNYSSGNVGPRPTYRSSQANTSRCQRRELPCFRIQ